MWLAQIKSIEFSMMWLWDYVFHVMYYPFNYHYQILFPEALIKLETHLCFTFVFCFLFFFLFGFFVTLCHSITCFSNNFLKQTFFWKNTFSTILEVINQARFQTQINVHPLSMGTELRLSERHSNTAHNTLPEGALAPCLTTDPPLFPQTLGES